VTTTDGGFGTTAGAVYKPAVVIFPHADPVQPLPERVQETVVFELPPTCAVNCWEAEGASFAVVGEIPTVITVTTVTDALADLLGSATDVAFTEKNGGLGGTAGAVYSPEVVIVPQVVPAQPVPLIVHVTAVLEEPLTVAVNCCCPPMPTWAVVGEIEMLMAPPEVIVTVADPDLVGSETDVAVTATRGGFGALAGAVYKPLLLMLPQLEPLHPLPETLQTTSELVVPFTVAVNCN
jgi:hypothetical protein